MDREFLDNFRKDFGDVATAIVLLKDYGCTKGEAWYYKFGDGTHLSLDDVLHGERICSNDAGFDAIDKKLADIGRERIEEERTVFGDVAVIRYLKTMRYWTNLDLILYDFDVKVIDSAGRTEGA